MPKTEELKPIGWRVWFEAGKVFDSKTSSWKDLPDDGVIIVVVYHQKRLRSGDGHYRTRYANQDYYWTMPNAPDEIFCSNENPLERYPDAVVKRGKWVPYDEYEKTCDKAMNTIEF